MRADRLLAVALATTLLAACAGKPERPPARTAKPAPAVMKPAVQVAAPAPAFGAKAPPPSDKTYAQALTQLKAKQLQPAETALLTVVKAYPHLTGPQTNLGIVYARSNRKAEAAAAFAKAVAADPGNAVAHNWLGVLAREAGDLRKAEQAYQQALAADPAQAQAQLNLAILYDQHLKRPADALAAYRRYDELTGRKDLRVAAWIAELQAQLTAMAAAQPTAAPAPPPTTPKPAVPPVKTGTKS